MHLLLDGRLAPLEMTEMSEHHETKYLRDLAGRFESPQDSHALRNCALQFDLLVRSLDQANAEIAAARSELYSTGRQALAREVDELRRHAELQRALIQQAIDLVDHDLPETAKNALRMALETKPEDGAAPTPEDHTPQLTAWNADANMGLCAKCGSGVAACDGVFVARPNGNPGPLFHRACYPADQSYRTVTFNDAVNMIEQGIDGRVHGTCRAAIVEVLKTARTA